MTPFIIPFISAVLTGAQGIPACLDQAGVAWQTVDAHNWADKYPYKPEVKFRLAHNGTHILVEYDVHESCIRAVAPADNGRVWQDACCELFIQPAGEGVYYNFECNCAGTLLIGSGPDRDHREAAPQEVLASVSRWASLGRGQKPLQEGDFHWQLALLLPASALYHHQISQLSGLTAHLNIYKCGDELLRPHFLSWQPVGTPTPDFHRPEYFGECRFE